MLRICPRCSKKILFTEYLGKLCINCKNYIASKTIDSKEGVCPLCGRLTSTYQTIGAGYLCSKCRLKYFRQILADHSRCPICGTSLLNGVCQPCNREYMFRGY
jgi:DNA-directed RNA polymerase subunit RPC12/RpoP